MNWKYHKILVSTLVLFMSYQLTCAQTTFLSSDYIHFQPQNGSFALVENQQAVPILLDSNDHSGVIKIARYFQDDIQKVTATKPAIRLNEYAGINKAVIVGTIGKNHLIDQMIKDGLIDIQGIQNQWESTLLQVVRDPLPGLDEALVIAGSDKRGTMYGMFDISRKIGVSPWYWWADVPVEQHSALFIKNGRYVFGSPKVKYRGIFLNDEEPALGRWAVENYGGFTHEFYEKVFELMLRLKANYFWPAMWWAKFNVDDPLNPELADEMGIVMGTTHHEPMMRAHKEWNTEENGPWDYSTNARSLRKFWKQGLERMNDHESIVTIGMRGDGDKAMTDETNIELLEQIVHDQRKIIRKVTGKDPAEVPQIWALYKEVQDYYDQGMEVPEDVTLLLCDDNWGNVRRLPELEDTARKGGYGMYYHFDYVGGPRNYKWLNTNQVTRTWEQMHLSYEYGVKELWLVNVGDLKPMELPISFFLDMAWDPDKWTADNIDEYTYLWAREQFGDEIATESAEILNKYTQYNARRKPELLDSDTYSLMNYQEFERVVADYNALEVKARNLYEQVPERQQAAFYQLVYHPVQACANLNELYYTVARNHLYAEQGRPETNQLTGKARELFEKDQAITDYYHHELMDGKWNHMMAQTHIGYTYWQQPDSNSMPEVKQIQFKQEDELNLTVQGSDRVWKFGENNASLPGFDSFNKQVWFIELFNSGSSKMGYTIIPSDDFVLFSQKQGEVGSTQRIHVKLDWENVPKGRTQSGFVVQSENQETIKVNLNIKQYSSQLHDKASGFIENNGVVSMEALHFSQAKHGTNVQWNVIPGLGRTHSGVTTFPVMTEIENPGNDSPVLEYDFFVPEAQADNQKVEVKLYFSPTLDFHDDGLFYAISIDGETPKIVNLHEDFSFGDWEEAVRNNCITSTTSHTIDGTGQHILRYWMMSGGVVLQKAVIDLGGLKPSYLGPPESLNWNINK